jgi:ribonuclease HI
VADSTGPRVFVDAKILGRHDAALPKKTTVAYVIEGTGVSDVCDVQADETDDAELHAIAFAIRELKNRLHEFTIVSDNQSVVIEIEEKKRKSGEKRPILLQILDELDSHPTIKVELLENNPAHRVLNKHLREHPA